MHFKQHLEKFGLETSLQIIYCKLIDSLPRRLQEVIKNKDGNTKYWLQTYFFKPVSVCHVFNCVK